MNKAHIEDLLDRYLKKETSVAENHFVEQWLEAQNNIDSEWGSLDPLTKDQWLTNVFVSIQNSIHTNEPIKMKAQNYLWYKIAGVAAIMLISLSVYLNWPQLQHGILSSELSTIATKTHQKKQITLPDGTQVWLNEGSELRYSKNFNGKERSVYLSGEAYFDVHHDENKPFLIHTGKVLTTVLGTAFNIKENNQTLEVTVTRGKVKVEDGGKLLSVLSRNQQLSVNLSDRSATEKMVDAKTVIAWQDTDLLFDDITFAEAVTQLQQRYKVRITFSNDQLKNCRFTGAALDGDQLEKVLKVICAFNNATWQTKADGSIIIDGRGCP